MSLDIGEAFGEGLSRLTTAGGLSLAVAFVAVALVSAVLTQTLLVEGLEALLEFYRGLSPEQLEVSQGEYDRQVSALETQLEVTRESSPLALEAPISVAAGGLLVVAILAEAVSVVAVRVFAAEEGETSPTGETDSLLLATLNGFVGGVLAAFGAAVVTRAYLQLREPEVDEETTADPYDAALGPDDIPE